MKRRCSCHIAPLIAALALLGTTMVSAAPSDPLIGDQWALDQVGATCAWQSTTGSRDIIVAIVDSGVDLQHPDFADRILPGYDFVDDDPDASDENGHGTNVAGIVAATLDNAEGIAGLAPGVSILPVRVMDASGRGSEEAIAAGVRFSAEQGARVINLSLGSTLVLSAEEESELVKQAIRDAIAGGAVVVVAAGNDFVPFPNSIAGETPDAMVIAALDPNDQKADFSNSGPWISVGAPGVQILSAMPTYEVFLTSDELPRAERFRNDYDYMSGTSQATPYVAALAALLLSADPALTPAEVREQIERTAVDISSINPDVEIGSGRIDACAALAPFVGQHPAQPTPETPDQSAQPTPETPDQSAQPTPALPGRPDVPGRPAPDPGRILMLLLVPVVACVLVFGGALLLIIMLVRAVTGGGRSGRAAPPPPAAAGAMGPVLAVNGPGGVQRYQIAGGASLIGRDAGCTIVISGDPTISRRHAVLRVEPQGMTLEDAGSSHGTFVNNRRITGATVLRRGDQLSFGQTRGRID